MREVVNQKNRPARRCNHYQNQNSLILHFAHLTTFSYICRTAASIPVVVLGTSLNVLAWEISVLIISVEAFISLALRIEASSTRRPTSTLVFVFCCARTAVQELPAWVV